MPLLWGFCKTIHFLILSWWLSFQRSRRDHLLDVTNGILRVSREVTPLQRLSSSMRWVLFSVLGQTILQFCSNRSRLVEGWWCFGSIVMQIPSSWSNKNIFPFVEMELNFQFEERICQNILILFKHYILVPEILPSLLLLLSSSQHPDYMSIV